MVRIGAFLLLGAMIWLGSHGVVLAQEAGGVSPLAAPIATDPAKDAALKDYLQKHFKIPSPDLIKLGPAFRTPIEGLFARQLIVSNEQGQNVSTSLFFDKNETKAIIGQYIDTSREPWGRTNMSGVSLDDRPTQGPANAPVTIVEFADFECPFCAHAFSVIETLVNTTYKGKVKVIFKAYPLNVHPWAMKAAEAAECARMQNPDAFWDFARYFYTNQGSIDAKNIQDNVDKLAKTEKLDAPSLKACMESAQTEASIKQDQTDGNSIHVSSTPTFFVNGIPVVGLPDGKIMDYVIESELSGKGPSSSAN
ncbi:thioredoxin domain-containing protein [Candidatus Binatus sp.]|uniref:thioredoxin domain-containing protein n=1 Tax=Candidatus Binatus sp. TaxID=2811406 RepID=UPI003BAF4C6A